MPLIKVQILGTKVGLPGLVTGLPQDLVIGSPAITRWNEGEGWISKGKDCCDQNKNVRDAGEANQQLSSQEFCLLALDLASLNINFFPYFLSPF